MCRIPLKKTEQKRWRSGHLVAFSSSSDLWSEGSGARQRGVAQLAHFCTCLLHHLTFSNPTRGRAKGLSRASYQGSVWRETPPTPPPTLPSHHQHRHVHPQALRLTLAANTRPESLFRPQSRCFRTEVRVAEVRSLLREPRHSSKTSVVAFKQTQTQTPPAPNTTTSASMLLKHKWRSHLQCVLLLLGCV